jgi:hypothetical protein
MAKVDPRMVGHWRKSTLGWVVSGKRRYTGRQGKLAPSATIHGGSTFSPSYEITTVMDVVS